MTSVKLQNGVTSIGYMAFNGCSSLISIEIPSSVTSIGGYAFHQCDNIKSIYCKATTPPSAGGSAFTNFSAMLHVPAGTKKDYQKAAIWENFTNIVEDIVVASDLAYNITSEENLTVEVVAKQNEKYTGDIVIPETTVIDDKIYRVTSIGNEAFLNCSGLTSIELPNGVTSIGGHAFAWCSGLTSIEIPSSLTKIENHAFSSCSGLTSIEIPDGVTRIGGGAFQYCSGLTSIEIPSSVKKIGDYAFGSCSGLEEIKVGTENTVYDSRNNCNAIIKTASNTLIAGCKNTVIPETVTSIGSDAFSHCHDLTSIELPSSVTSIGWYAFSGCTDLTSIEIPSSVKSIGSGAFQDCDNIKNVYCQAITPPSAGGSAFTNFSATLHVPAGTKKDYQKAAIWKNFKNIVEDIIPDGIKSIKAERNEGIRYNLRGQRVEQPRKGEIYMENGRKRLAR